MVQDFTTTSLAAIPNLFGRLAYIASLRDLSSGNYEHCGLAALYSPQTIQEALECCHHEIFNRILETPLAIQAEDLRECLQGMPGLFVDTVANWRRMESYRIFPPASAPGYLRELFFSNLRALLEILDTENSRAHLSA